MFFLRSDYKLLKKKLPPTSAHFRADAGETPAERLLRLAEGDIVDTEGKLELLAPATLRRSRRVVVRAAVLLLLLLPLLFDVLPDAVELSSPTCFFAWPSSVLRQRVAKLREQIVSPRLYTAGLMLTNVMTFEFPPNESYGLCNREKK